MTQHATRHRPPSLIGSHCLGRAIAIALALAAAVATPANADPEPPVTPRSEQAPELRLTGEVVTLPIVMVREFPFIEGSIAGVPGKLMLDTGAENALTVNDHRVRLTGGRSIGRGFFGSGQTFEIRLVPEVTDIRIGELRYPRVTEVQAQDARLLEGITPDFIGWLGFHAFANHALKLDYRNLEATFYAHAGTDYLARERVIAALTFETRKLPNHPIMAGRIGDTAVTTSWDTGQNGGLYTSEAVKARLLDEGRLKPSPIKPDSFDLHGLELNGHAMPVLEAIMVSTDPFPARTPIGITEPDYLSIGYSLLRQFKTIWDYRAQRIYLLER